MALPFITPSPAWVPIHPSITTTPSPPPPQKLKLLCSFGGQILPRPGDGALRYAGGHTRIISVPKDITFSHLIQRIADSCGVAGPIILKYKLPTEDLDALVSVSCEEDLDNMIEEFDKLAKTHPDGSPKLRAFLFSSGEPRIEDVDDAGQRYVEAVNGFGSAEGGSGTLRKEGSSSSQNSDAQIVTEAADVNYDGTCSPALTCSAPQGIGMVGAPLGINAPPFAQKPYLASDFHITTAPPASQVSSFKPVQTWVEQNPYGGGFVNPQSHIQPTLSPALMQPQSVYGFGQVPLQGQVLRFENCIMCQKALPHAHSDVAAQQNCIEFPNSSSVLYSHHSDMKTKNLVDGPMASNQFGAPGLPRIKKYERERPILPKIDDLGATGFLQPPVSMGLLGQTQTPHAVLVGNKRQQEVFIKPLGFDANSVKNVNVQASQVLNTIGKPDPYLPNLGISIQPPVLNGWQLGMPMHSCGIDPVYNDRIIMDMYNPVPTAQNVNAPFPLPNTTSPTRHVNPFQEPEGSDSLFSNEDPLKVLGGAYFVPPKPRWVSKHEVAVLKNLCLENNLGNKMDSETVALFEEGALDLSPGNLNKDIRPKLVRSPQGEENIKQEAQVLDEGGAIPVLQPFLPPVSVFFGQETEDHAFEFGKEKGIIGRMIEDMKPTPSGSMLPALQIKEGLGRLQIIKNSDLEELRELGSGTFGTVYHGKWRGTDVAIKRINERCFAGKPSEEERMRSDFWNEASKLADLHHPNVVAFYGVVLDGPGGSVATVTEYMINGSLRTALRRKTLDRRKRLLIAMDVAFGMEYLHGKNIVHFDLKSDNLLVNLRDPHRPICKVGDLGLSKVKCKTLISGGVRGTLPWMAPELLDGSRNLVSEKVDVFSYGIVMWELLTGDEPYEDLHYGAIIGGIVTNTLRPPIPESCEPEWGVLMEKCWSSESSDRPNFTEVANGLRSMAASLPQKGQKGETQK